VFGTLVFVSCFGLPWRDEYASGFISVKQRTRAALYGLFEIQVWAREFGFEFTLMSFFLPPSRGLPEATR
jgi:hypothetical protein